MQLAQSSYVPSQLAESLESIRKKAAADFAGVTERAVALCWLKMHALHPLPAAHV